MKCSSLSYTILAIWLSGPALAQNAAAGIITASEIEVGLAPSDGPRMRGVSVLRGVSPSMDFAIQFAYNSSELTDDAKLQLAQIALAFQGERLKAQKFMIVGHTDAVGGDAYNQVLSASRAEAVRRFLLDDHGIESWRLEAEGRGETELLDPARPNDSSNRRVQIITTQ